MTIRKQLSALRLAGYRWRDIAAAACVDIVTVQRWKAGTRSPANPELTARALDALLKRR